ncbi:MAG: LysM peptidoglycan-binding domain-containing protein, partial [Pseudomonadota bacterium]|nr:LysM peptidoglycan-binding domain-containing protein [Pseudomonadota bacterium]
MKLELAHFSPGRGPTAALIATLLLAMLVGCASPRHRAPVEDRSPAARESVPMPPPVMPPASIPAAEPSGKPLPGIENAGKPGYYTVKRGDTLFKVAQTNGQGWRDIARWNNLENPSSIEIGQVLRIVPPGQNVASLPSAQVGPAASAPVVVVKPVAVAPQPEVRPLDPQPPPVKEGDDNIDWLWPASG